MKRNPATKNDRVGSRLTSANDLGRPVIPPKQAQEQFTGHTLATVQHDSKPAKAPLGSVRPIRRKNPQLQHDPNRTDKC
jgi:hypothetical protein